MVSAWHMHGFMHHELYACMHEGGGEAFAAILAFQAGGGWSGGDGACQDLACMRECI